MSYTARSQTAWLRDQYSSEMNFASRVDREVEYMLICCTAVKGIYKRVIEGNKNRNKLKKTVSKEEPYVTRSKYDT